MSFFQRCINSWGKIFIGHTWNLQTYTFFHKNVNASWEKTCLQKNSVIGILRNLLNYVKHWARSVTKTVRNFFHECWHVRLKENFYPQRISSQLRMRLFLLERKQNYKKFVIFITDRVISHGFKHPC